MDGAITQPARGITWTDAPVSIAYCYPYIIGVCSRYVEVISIFDSALKTYVQQIPIKAKVIVSKMNTIFAVGSKELWRILPVPLVKQLEELIHIKAFDEALTLIQNLPPQDGDPQIKVFNSLLSLSSFLPLFLSFLILSLSFWDILSCFPSFLLLILLASSIFENPYRKRVVEVILYDSSFYYLLFINIKKKKTNK